MRRLLLGLLLFVSPACAPLSRQVPAYPQHGQTAAQIETDIAACTTWAESATDDPGTSAVAGAVGGAVIVAGLGAAFGAVLYAILKLDPAEGAAVGASLGGIMGATEGAGAAGETAAQRQRGAYASCMETRGYRAAIAR